MGLNTALKDCFTVEKGLIYEWKEEEEEEPELIDRIEFM